MSLGSEVAKGCLPAQGALWRLVAPDMPWPYRLDPALRRLPREGQPCSPSRAARSNWAVPSTSATGSGRRNDRRRRAERERRVAVMSLIDCLLDLGLSRDVSPFGDHGHHAVGPNADENVRPVVDLSHGLHLSSRGSSVPHAGSSSPSRPCRPPAALPVRASNIVRSAASGCRRRSAADASPAAA